MNRVIMMGRIASDIEQRTTQQGTSLCSFRLAVERNYQKKGEERVSDFFNVVAWRASGDFISKYFSKGKMIMIEGEMITRQYTDKNGNLATWYEILVENVFFTGEKKDGAAQSTPSQNSEQPKVPQNTGANSNQDAYQDASQFGGDDYPF